jgi:hypothetical protein
MADSTEHRQPRRLDRRAFLTGTGLAGAAAATVAATGLAVEAREEPEEQIKGRYAETPHVKRFYDMNRI